MPKLTHIWFHDTPRALGLAPRAFTPLECEAPLEQLIGWYAVLRGTALFLVSPPGWKSGIHRNQFDSKGPRAIVEIPRSNCTLCWSGGEADLEEITKGKFVTPPFERPRMPEEKKASLLEQLDPSQLGDP